MTDHLVEQVEYTGTVGLRCHTCDWFMNIGHHGGMSIDQRQHIQPLVTLLRWAHTDPTLVEPRWDGEVVEQSTWRRVRQYLVGGQR